MANKSNRELTDEALALGALLGKTVETEGLKNPQLVELVAGLQALFDALPPLPADHKRPTVEEFVASGSGYLAENYEAHMLSWEREIRARLGAEARAAAGSTPSPGLVDGNDVGTAGGVPPGRPLDPPAATLDRPEALSRLVNGDGVDARGGAPKPAAPTGPVIRYPYVVAEGKVVTTLRGPKGAFDPIGASDFKGGQEALDTLVSQGFVTKR